VKIYFPEIFAFCKALKISKELTLKTSKLLKLKQRMTDEEWLRKEIPLSHKLP
jgi:hypothetical protein